MGEHPEAIVEYGHEYTEVEVVDGEGLKFVDGAEVWDVRLQELQCERRVTAPDNQVPGVL